MMDGTVTYTSAAALRPVLEAVAEILPALAGDETDAVSRRLFVIATNAVAMAQTLAPTGADFSVASLQNHHTAGVSGHSDDPNIHGQRSAATHCTEAPRAPMRMKALCDWNADAGAAEGDLHFSTGDVLVVTGDTVEPRQSSADGWLDMKERWADAEYVGYVESDGLRDFEADPPVLGTFSMRRVQTLETVEPGSWSMLEGGLVVNDVL